MPVRSPAPISLDQLLALNDEIAALARAGVPLDQGLRVLGRDMPGRLGRIAESLGQRLESGEDLIAALEHSGGEFPAVYRAVVLAGLKSGRLAFALEGIASTVRRVAETRRVMIVSMVYPLVVLVVASAVFALTVLGSAPIVASAYRDFAIEQPRWYRALTWLADNAYSALPWVWLALGVLLVVWWVRSRRASVIQGRGVSTIRRMYFAGRMASFADLLALLIEQQVPLPEAVALAASASGDAALGKAGETVARRLRDGRPVGDLPPGFPPLMGWLLVGGASPDQLVQSLRQMADGYRRRASRMGQWLGVYLPVALSAGIGGAVTLLYVLLVIAPFYFLLFQFSFAG